MSPEIVVVGCGAVGLPLALAFAARGRRTLGVESDPARLDRLTAAAIAEDPERLDTKLGALSAEGRIGFSARPARGDGAGRCAFVIAVPTPAHADGRFDDRALATAVQAGVAAAAPGDLIAIRSTVPIGTTRALAARHDPQGRLLWASCPDRSFAGRAFADQLAVPHLVGGLTPEAAEAAADLFALLGRVLGVSTPEAAEATKLFANVQRDLRFAIANAFAEVCEAAGVDLSEVRRAGADGFAFDVARPGPVGGPCLGKDALLLAASRGLDATPPQLVLAGRAQNAGLAKRTAERILADLGPGAAGEAPRIAILGLAFKGAPPVRSREGGFADALAAELRGLRPQADLHLWDPVADPSAGRAAALWGASAVVLANDHPALADLAAVAEAAPGARVYDMCGLTLGRPVPAGLSVRVFGEGTPR